MPPSTGGPAYTDDGKNTSSVACGMDRQQRKGFELFAFPQKLCVSKLFRGFRQERQVSMTKEVAFAADANLPVKNGRRNALCRCNRDKGSINIAVPLIGFVRRTVSYAFPQLGYLKQSPSKRNLEAELPFETNVSKRRVRPRDELRGMAPLEKHLLLVMLSQVDAKSYCSLKQETGASSCSCNDTTETAVTLENDLDTQFFCAGGFLHSRPIESSKLAQILIARKRKKGRRKQNTLGFACLQGGPLSPLMLAPDSVHPEVRSEGREAQAPQSHPSGEPQRSPFVPLHGPSLTALMESLPLIKFVIQYQAFPDKEKLTSVQDFFRYTESEGRRVFQELDRDKDGQITLDDLKVAMEKMKLPSIYARKFLLKTQTHWLAKSFGWPEFSSLIQEKEPMMICLFNSLGVSKSGTVQRTNVKDLLRNAGLSATEDNASAMMEFLGVTTEDSLKYGQFRKFMLLVPTEQLISDPWSVWFKAATSGPETSTQNLLEYIFGHVTLMSRGLAHQFQTAKATVVLPDVRSFEGVSNLLRPGNRMFRERLTMPGAGILHLTNAVKEVTELQIFRSFKANIPGQLNSKPL